LLWQMFLEKMPPVLHSRKAAEKLLSSNRLSVTSVRIDGVESSSQDCDQTTGASTVVRAHPVNSQKRTLVPLHPWSQMTIPRKFLNSQYSIIEPIVLTRRIMVLVP